MVVHIIKYRIGMVGRIIKVMNIDKLYEMLSCNNPENIQQQGIADAKKIKNLSVLIMPFEDKTIWENCAKVLAQKNDEELKQYLPPLFEWLQDMNWPGADIIYDRLLHVAKDMLIPIYQYSLSCAAFSSDTVWEEVLHDFMKEYHF